MDTTSHHSQKQHRHHRHGSIKPPPNNCLPHASSHLLSRERTHSTPPSSTHDLPTNYSITHFLRSRSLHASSPTTTHFDHLIANRLPDALLEVIIPTLDFDKIFASLWIDDVHVLVGTKCNKVLCINVRSSRTVEIPFKSIITTTPSSTHINDDHSPLYRPPLPSSNRRRDSAIDIPLSPLKCTGIHSIVMNPSRTHVAVGGSGELYQAVIYSIPDLVPVCVLSGHTDLVFSMAFISDEILVTGSRDTTMCIYSLTAAPHHHISYFTCHLPVLTPNTVNRQHGSKIRDLKYHTGFQNLVTLCMDGSVRVWDMDRIDVVSTPAVQYRSETCCLGMDSDHSVFSVGSQSHISLFDLRRSATKRLHDINSLNEGWGVRSIVHRHNIVTCGGGLGRVGFFDSRALRYLRMGHMDSHVYKEASVWFNGTSGSVVRQRGLDSTATDHALIPSAIYTMNYSEDGTRLFTGGGPLQLGIRGSYCAVW